jgi:hypothetical protein
MIRKFSVGSNSIDIHNAGRYYEASVAVLDEFMHNKNNDAGSEGAEEKKPITSATKRKRPAKPKRAMNGPHGRRRGDYSRIHAVPIPLQTRCSPHLLKFQVHKAPLGNR